MSSPVPVSPLARALRGLTWYLRRVSGEARYDDHLAACRRDGVEPMSRRDFERHRAHLKERSPTSRCC